MQLEQQESFEIKGPQLEIFGEVESKLPPPAKKHSVAAAVLVVLALLSVFGIGGAKLKGRYNGVQAVYTQTDAHNHGIQTELAAQADAAASLLRQCQAVLGAEDADCKALDDALGAWNNAGVSPAEQSRISTGMYTAVETVYNAARTKADSDTKSRIDSLHDAFVAAHLNVNIYVTEDYTPAVESYNKTASGFPANVIGTLWGVGQAEAYVGQ